MSAVFEIAAGKHCEMLCTIFMSVDDYISKVIPSEMADECGSNFHCFGAEILEVKE
jgi:hypothetical protein